MQFPDQSQPPYLAYTAMYEKQRDYHDQEADLRSDSTSSPQLQPRRHSLCQATSPVLYPNETLMKAHMRVQTEEIAFLRKRVTYLEDHINDLHTHISQLMLDNERLSRMLQTRPPQPLQNGHAEMHMRVYAEGNENWEGRPSEREGKDDSFAVGLRPPSPVARDQSFTYDDSHALGSNLLADINEPSANFEHSSLQAKQVQIIPPSHSQMSIHNIRQNPPSHSQMPTHNIHQNPNKSRNTRAVALSKQT